ncbi:MAG: hypothetical protein JOY64_13740 [Alphaproteobacteria bacterium]|nr:hypothetical protein [Alphaproteobacteria bacterium]
MVRRTFRVCVRVVLGTMLVASALLVVIALRLMAGPVSLDFLKERIASATDAPGNNVRPEVDHITLEWGGLGRPIRLAFHGLRFVNAENQVVASAPSAGLTFDPRSVIRGIFLPTSVTIEKPTIEADIDREGGILRRIFAHPDAQSQDQAVGILVEQLLAEPNYDSLVGQLDSVRIEQAKVTLRDVKTGLAWTAPDARAELKRDQRGVIISASARFIGHSGDPFDVWLDGVYSRDRSRISVEANVEGFKPSVLADLSPDVALLRGVNVVLAGRLRVETDGNGDIRTVVTEVTAGDGQVTLPGVLPASHKVKDVQARILLDGEKHSVSIERLSLDFGAATVMVTGSLARNHGQQTFSGRAEVKHVPVDRLGDYWPLEFSAGGRQWALANLSSGEIDVAADFGLTAPVGDLAALKLDRMVGSIDYRGMSVRYMPHMPELQAVFGKARYENGALRFDVASGKAVGLSVKDASIELTGLDGPPPQNAEIHMPITGSAQDVMRFLSRPKLGLSRDLLYDYRRIGGEAAIDLSLRFPLAAALAVSDIEIKTDATVSHFSLQDALGDVDLTDANGKVQYSGSEFAVTGTGKLDGNSVDIAWRQMFDAKAPFRSRYDLKGTIPAALVAKAGFPPIEPYVSGPMVATVTYQVATNGTSEMNGRFDLRGASVDAAPLDWRKAPGSEGLVTLDVKLAQGGKLSSIDFEGRGDGLLAKGQARFTGDNALQAISLSQLGVGPTNVAIDWTRGPLGVEVSVRGALLELPRVRHAMKVRDELAAKDPRGAAAQAHTKTRLTLQLQQITTQHGSLGYANGSIDLAADRIAAADLAIGAGQGSTLRVTPAGNGRNLALFIADFGLMMQEAGWVDGMLGGTLQINGHYDDASANLPFAGLLKMGPYRLQKVTPRWGVGTLNSAIDGLARAGNALQQFDSLKADIGKLGDRINIKNGRTSGASIGLTTQGFVDLGNETARLAGVVVPAFAFNNLLSNVPLLGPLLTGGKDAGLFAVAYQLYGPFDDLRTSINMLSAVTPGALRDLFTSVPDDSTPPTPIRAQPTR